MGYYIDPPNITKEQWLKENGEKVELAEPLKANHHIVCLIDNGPFTAAGIAYDELELSVFTFNDGRDKEWFQVPDEALIKVCPGIARVLA